MREQLFKGLLIVLLVGLVAGLWAIGVQLSIRHAVMAVVFGVFAVTLAFILGHSAKRE